MIRKTGMFAFSALFTLVVAACNPQNATGSCPTASAAPAAVSNVVSVSGPLLPSVRQRPLISHRPKVLKNFSDVGLLSENQNLSVTIELSLNHEADLDQQLAQMYTPGSASYHRYLSPQEFREKYAPTVEQVAAVQSQLEAQGITTTVLENGYLLKAEGSVGAMNMAFNTEIHQYMDSKGTPYYAPAYEPQVPTNSIIRAVHGLHNITRWRTHAILANASPLKAGSGPNGGLSPSDIQQAYSVPTSATGSGETLALFELDGYTASDITQYEKTFNLPNVSLSNVLVDTADGSAGDGADEVTLDIELMAAVAPGAKQILVYEGPNSNQGVLDVYAKIANDNKAREVSTSWGAPEAENSSSFLQTENTVFKQMAAQGQTIYAAAGDSGADDNGTSLSVDDPSSQPYVIGVGGTKLFTTANGAYDHETTWNEDGKPADGGGGGGISTVWTLPTWQQNAISTASLGSTKMRNTPDVSLDADPATGYAIYVGGQWNVFGGTSCAAPLWAAFTALVNQTRISNNLAALGFANPVFYNIGLSTTYTTDFNDIADGSTNMHFPAVSGHDNATGWGSFKGQSLYNDLVKDSLVLAPAPTPITTTTTVGCTL